jgi:hypothetical protein
MSKVDELANWLETGEIEEIDLKESATMLRQQQAELDAFKLQYYNTGYSLQLRDKDETIRQQQAEIEDLKNPIMQAIAMAFEPLTDDEIDMLVHEYNLLDDHPHEFVRACIRKATREMTNNNERN